MPSADQPRQRLLYIHTRSPNVFSDILGFTQIEPTEDIDLEADPQEMHNLVDDPARAKEVASWRGHLIAQLNDRPEGFTDGKKLIEQDGPTMLVLQSVIDEAKSIEQAK